jgi:transposase-like protein
MSEDVHCDNCGSDDVTGGIGTWSFETNGVKLLARHVLYRCESCGRRFVDSKGKAIRDAVYNDWVERQKVDAK